MGDALQDAYNNMLREVEGDNKDNDKNGDKGFDVSGVIKSLISTSFGGSNEEQMKAVQLLKGLATSDDPAANKFMQRLDKFTSGMKNSGE